MSGINPVQQTPVDTKGRANVRVDSGQYSATPVRGAEYLHKYSGVKTPLTSKSLSDATPTQVDIVKKCISELGDMIDDRQKQLSVLSGTKHRNIGKSTSHPYNSLSEAVRKLHSSPESLRGAHISSQQDDSFGIDQSVQFGNHLYETSFDNTEESALDNSGLDISVSDMSFTNELDPVKRAEKAVKELLIVKVANNLLRKSLRDVRYGMENEMTKAASEKREIEDQNDQLREAIHKLRTDHESFTEERAQLKHSQLSNVTKLKECEEELAFAKRQLKTFEGEVELYRSKHGTARKDVSICVDELELPRLPNRVVLDAATYDNLLAEKAELRLKCSRLEEDRQTAVESISDLKQKAKDVEDRFFLRDVAATESESKHKEIVTELTNRIAELSSENLALQERVGDLELRFSEAQSDRSKAMDALSKKDEHCHALLSDCVEARALLAESESDKTELATMKAKQETLATVLSSHEREQQQLQSKIEKLTLDLNESHKVEVDLSRELFDVKQQLESVRLAEQKLQQSQEQWTKRETELIAKLQQREARGNEDLHQSENRVQDLTHQLQHEQQQARQRELHWVTTKEALEQDIARLEKELIAPRVAALSSVPSESTPAIVEFQVPHVQKKQSVVTVTRRSRTGLLMTIAFFQLILWLSVALGGVLLVSNGHSSDFVPVQFASRVTF